MKDQALPSRRDFLRVGATSLAAAALLPSTSCSPQSKQTSRQLGEPIYRTLGRTGLNLPVVSMGSCYAINLVQAALDAGFVYVHTSSGYGEQEHERILGQVFRDRPRDSFVVGTSPELPWRYDRGRGRSNPLNTDADPALIAECMEASLQRLGLDHVDIYYLLSVGTREVAFYQPYFDAFARLKREGKTRFVGIGTHENEPEVIAAAAECGFWDVVLTAYNFRQTHHREIAAALQRAVSAGLGVVAMKTQAGVYWDRLRQRKINMPAALKWVLQNENVHTTIPAFASFDEMQEDLTVMRDLKLTPEERRDLRLGEELGLSGCFCQQCGQCRAQCPADLDVPSLMRAHMYACGHRQAWKARRMLHTWTRDDVACLRCDHCTVRCALGLDVRSRAHDLAATVLSPPGSTT